MLFNLLMLIIIDKKLLRSLLKKGKNKVIILNFMTNKRMKKSKGLKWKCKENRNLE